MAYSEKRWGLELTVRSGKSVRRVLHPRYFDTRAEAREFKDARAMSKWRIKRVRVVVE